MTIDTIVYFLEYSEKQNCFHYNNGGVEPGSNGFAVIAKNVPRYKADKFTWEVCKYHAKLERAATTEEVKKYYDNYMEKLKIT